MRARHSVPALVADVRATEAAQEWAEELYKINILKHGNHEGMGQNLFSNVGAEVSARKIVEYWYSEVKSYDFNDPGFSPDTGHFTQVVWKDTTGIGVGRVYKNRRGFVVCNYVPPGNVAVVGRSSYVENVLPPQH